MKLDIYLAPQTQYWEDRKDIRLRLFYGISYKNNALFSDEKNRGMEYSKLI